MGHGHYIRRCVCGVVVEQCKCIAGDKSVRIVEPCTHEEKPRTPQVDDPRLPRRFWAKVTPCPMSGCWLWVGSTRGNGYGDIHWQHSYRQVHRVAYEALVGQIPQGLQLDHLCLTPVCVNPLHLEPVTSGDNTRRYHKQRASRRVSKGPTDGD